MSNKVKHWHSESRKPKKNKKLVPLRVDSGRVSPLRVDSSRVSPLPVDDLNDWEDDFQQ